MDALRSRASQVDIAGSWIERREQQYWTVQNGSDNAEIEINTLGLTGRSKMVYSIFVIR